jgi:hypothetical protein
MKPFWLIMLPVISWSPVVCRYFRIQTNTNPFFKEVCFHTKGKILSSFLPDVPFKEVFQETIHDCVEKQDVEFVAKHLVTQFISYEINDGIHKVIHNILENKA